MRLIEGIIPQILPVGQSIIGIEQGMHCALFLKFCRKRRRLVT
jgi:hypothetical protein